LLTFSTALLIRSSLIGIRFWYLQHSVFLFSQAQFEIGFA
jgi:hypothetical protein